MELKLVAPFIGKSLVFRLFNADNEVFGFLDGELLVDKKTEGDPSFQEDSARELSTGFHRLVVGGVNWGGPAHYRWSIILDGVVRDEVDLRQGASPNGLSYYVAYSILTP